MTASKIEIFREMTSAEPDNALVWYGLGSEYFKAEQWREAAIALGEVVRLNPGYTAAYQMLGSAHERLGEGGEARGAWQQGVEVAERAGAWKARDHMRALLQGIAGNASVSNS